MTWLAHASLAEQVQVVRAEESASPGQRGPSPVSLRRCSRCTRPLGRNNRSGLCTRCGDHKRNGGRGMSHLAARSKSPTVEG